MATTVKTNKVSQKFDTPEDVADLVEEMQAAADTLETLILEGNSYGIEAARAIGSALEMCHRVKHLGLNDMFISRLKSEIPEALRLMFGGVMMAGASVETLNLNDNAIGPVTMPELLPFLQDKSCASLKALRLNNCGLGIKGGNMLSTVLPGLENLQELIIGRNRLEIDGVRDISNALQKLNNLEILELPQNGTKHDGIVALVAAIESNPKLRVLNLNDNVLRGKDQLLATAIQGLKNLEVLNLGDCLLKTAGCISIMSAIQHLCNANGVCHLREIILNGNEIGKSAGDSITAALEQLLASRVSDHIPLKVDLSSNNLGEDLVERLRNQFGSAIELIVEDDEGSGDEGGDDEQGDGGDQDDEVSESSPTKNGFREAHDDGQVPSIDDLLAKYESNFTSLAALSSEFFRCSSRGYRQASNSLSERAQVEIEALIKVGQSHQAPNRPYELANCLLVACGLIKSEDKSLMPARGQDLTGGLLGLGTALKHFTAKEPQKCIKNFLQKSVNDPKYEKIKSSLFSYIYSF